ncbi:MAG: hypothetical protein LBF70_00965 [Holosporales bacterium]|jgi:hypothetical protein|nr:hypothetical protein [Holosporales bacterium]
MKAVFSLVMSLCFLWGGLVFDSNGATNLQFDSDDKTANIVKIGYVKSSTSKSNSLLETKRTEESSVARITEQLGASSVAPKRNKPGDIGIAVKQNDVIWNTYVTAARLSLRAMNIRKETGFNRAKTPDNRRDCVKKGIDLINSGSYSLPEKAAVFEMVLALGASSVNELRKEAALKFYGYDTEPLKTHLQNIAEYIMPCGKLQIKNTAIALTEAIEEVGKVVGDQSFKIKLEQQMTEHYKSNS